MKADLKLECDYLGQIETSYQDTQLRVSLKNVNVDVLISEVLENVEIEKILMQIDPETLSNEIQRRLDEDFEDSLKRSGIPFLVVGANEN